MNAPMLVLCLVCAGAAAGLLVPGAVGSLPVRPSPRDDVRPATSRPHARLLACAGASVGAGYLLGGWPGLLAMPVVAALSWRYLSGREPPAARRRREELQRTLPHAVDLLAAALAAGAAPVEAVRLVAGAVRNPLREELVSIFTRLTWGSDPVRTWAQVARHPQLGPLGRCMVRATESGSSVADAMSRLAEDLRRVNRAERESRARAVGVKAAAPLGMCLLPAFVLTGVVPLVAGALSRLSGL